MAAGRTRPGGEKEMLYEAIDDVVLAVDSIANSRAVFERLGMKVLPAAAHPGTGVETCAIATGDAGNLFFIIMAMVADEQEAAQSPIGRSTLAASRAGGGVFGLGLRVANLDTALQDLATKGVEAAALPDGGGVRMAPLAPSAGACAPLTLIQYGRSTVELHTGLAGMGAFDHALRLKRLDHLAAAAPDHEMVTSYWNERLGIPTWGEIVTKTTVIRQMKIGGAIVELLGPASPDSPIRSRKPGLSSMNAFEVPDLEAAVATARERGFTVSDPATGSLPGTRVARIPADELCGLGLQLLEYV